MSTNFYIEESEIENAKIKCSSIKDSKTRNRAVANVLAGNLAKKFFEENSCEIDTENCLRNIPEISEEIDISDIYYNDNYIDVRLYFEEKQMCVPKSHFENNILPVAYMFIKVSKDLNEAELAGFIKPEDINKSNETDEVYPVDYSSLYSFALVADKLNYNNFKYIDDSEIYAFADRNLENKGLFYEKLTHSKQARILLKKVLNAKNILGQVINLDNLSERNNTNEDNEVFDQETDSNYDDDYDFSTVVTPSISDIDSAEEIPENIVEQESILNEINFKEKQEDIEEINEDDLTKEENNIQNEDIQQTEEINTLFNDEDQPDGDSSTNFVTKKKTSSIAVIVSIIAILMLISGGIYFWITNSSQQPDELQTNIQTELPPAKETNSSESANNNEAMPVETVSTKPAEDSEEMGNAIDIPAIEKNLDASIIVSNLKVDWEVPSGYVSNTSAKRYLVKLGKIIQLNLKTELLLLSRPPITNRIGVELKFNDNTGKFETVGIVTSSGEKTVDNLILQTVNKALDVKLNINTDNFSKISGNPVLIIKL